MGHTAPRRYAPCGYGPHACMAITCCGDDRIVRRAFGGLSELQRTGQTPCFPGPTGGHPHETGVWEQWSGTVLPLCPPRVPWGVACFGPQNVLKNGPLGHSNWVNNVVLQKR